jgi:hypothetical protein
MKSTSNDNDKEKMSTTTTTTTTTKNFQIALFIRAFLYFILNLNELFSGMVIHIRKMA